MSTQALPTETDHVSVQQERATFHARIDRFVRTTSPQILRLALQPECADLLTDLDPLDSSLVGSGWRSITLPLQKYHALLRRDFTDLIEVNRGRGGLDAFRDVGSNATFVETHLPHIGAEAQLTAQMTSNRVGRDLATTVRLAAVVAALSAFSLHVGVIPYGLALIDDDVATFTRPVTAPRVTGPTPALPILVEAYLQAKEKETA